jgi:hypothetical protein
MSDDDLDDLLSSPAVPAGAALRDLLREKTTRRLRRGRQVRRLAVAAALAACYAAGVATVWFTRPVPRTPDPIIVEVPRNHPEIPPDTSPRSPRDLEMAAEMADGADSARLFLDAARAFAQRSEWDSALRCYRNALDAGGGDLAIDPNNDDWLMVTLKLARKEEQSHANVDN